MTQSKQRNQYIDVWKAMACVFVVLIHSVFPGRIGIVFRALARFAVPLFFMVSGFYFYDENSNDMKKKVWPRIKKLLVIIGVSAIGYFVLELAENMFIQGDVFEISTYLSELFSREHIVRFLVTNTPLIYMPRWFLYALIYCYLFCSFICKGNRKKLYVGAVLLLICNMIMEYSTILNIFNFQIPMGHGDVIFTIYNIFIFRALPWFMFGMLFNEYSYRVDAMSVFVYWVSCIIGIVTTILQVLLLGDFTIHIGTLFIVFGLFGIAIKRRTVKCNQAAVHIGNKLSLYVFVLHGAVISAMSLLEKLIFNGNSALWFAWTKPILVIVITLIGAQVIYRISSEVTNRRK